MMAEALAAADFTLQISRVFHAPQERVFRAWIDESEIKQWWGPEGYTAHIDTFDPTPGGAYRIDMRSPEGSSHWLRGEFKEVSPHDKLVFTWIWEQGNLADLEMLVTVEFKPLGEATEVTLTHAKLPSEGAREAHSQGWTSCFECLTEHVQGS